MLFSVYGCVGYCLYVFTRVRGLFLCFQVLLLVRGAILNDIWVPELIQLVLPYNQEYRRKTHEQECALATVTTEN
jgi:hypothetical protein